MNEDWTALEYQRQKRNFIESRLFHRSVYFDASLIFAFTLLVGWLCSWLLLKMGMRSLPLRYAISFGLSYLGFVMAVRVWADFTREMRPSSTDLTGADGLGFANEGCLLVLAAWVIGLLLAAVFAWVGGLPLLLEVAFEVVFAGAIVRRAGHKQVLGDWLGAVVRKTRAHALVFGVVLVALAAYLQQQAPAATTLRQAITVLLK